MVYQTARSDLLDLEARGILVRTKRGRRFVFHAVPDLGDAAAGLVESPEPRDNPPE